ncbi:hypothetical protein SDC9_115307 [bioreactor metagenome]|uniref:Uncharacterized protein n=1 Tax=bioreactor metagenome TaxID=1076179 RepID=A0A645BSS3_9ZZZZ
MVAPVPSVVGDAGILAHSRDREVVEDVTGSVERAAERNGQPVNALHVDIRREHIAAGRVVLDGEHPCRVGNFDRRALPLRSGGRKRQQ